MFLLLEPTFYPFCRTDEFALSHAELEDILIEVRILLNHKICEVAQCEYLAQIRLEFIKIHYDFALANIFVCRLVCKSRAAGNLAAVRRLEITL